MGRSKDHNSYSPQICDMVEKLAIQDPPRQQIVKLPSREAAMALRSTFYSYMTACSRDAENVQLQLTIKTFKKTYLLKVRGDTLIFALRFDEPFMDALTEKMMEMDLENMK